MNKTRTLRLISYNYDEPRDIIRWKVRDETPGEEVREYTLAWPGSDLANQFGIKSKLPAKLIIDFSEQMKNRVNPFYMENEFTVKAQAENWSKDTSENSILEAHTEIDHFPFYEVEQQIKEEKNK
jgi:hypothetical protein